MKIFYIYLIKRSFLFSLFILLVFGVLDSVFRLLSELENISDSYDFLNIINFIFASMPHNIIGFVEGACLLGVMISLGISHKEGNLNVLRSAGSSPFKIVALSSVGALLIVIPLLVLDDISFRHIYLDSQIDKNVLLEKKVNQDDIKWIKYKNSFLSYNNIINNKVFNPQLIKIVKKDKIVSIKSSVAEIKDNNLIFDNNKSEYFELPLRAKVSYQNIDHEGISKIALYRSYFASSIIKEDILFKAHLDKVFFKTIFLPFSIFILITYFGSLIFTSLRDSNLGMRITVAVFGAFIYKLLQDLSIGIFISYNLPMLFGVILPAMMLALLSLDAYRKI